MTTINLAEEEQTLVFNELKIRISTLCPKNGPTVFAYIFDMSTNFHTFVRHIRQEICNKSINN